MLTVETKCLSICECGFPILDESIPLGTKYQVDQNRRLTARFTCGGCHKEFSVETVWAKNRNNDEGGYIPAAVFGL